MENIDNEIRQLELKIEKQRKFCREEVIPRLRNTTDRLLGDTSICDIWLTYKYNKVKLLITKFCKRKRTGCNRAYVRIIIKYKYKKVLELVYPKDDSKYTLKEFHACEWIEQLPGLCNYADNVQKRKLEKAAKKKLERELKKVKQSCKKYEALCDD